MHTLTNNIIYISLGLTTWWLAYRTGGMEASVALHAAMNIFGRWILPLVDFSNLPDRVDNGVLNLILTVFVVLTLNLIIDLLARRRGLVRMSSPSAAASQVVKAGRMAVAIASKEDLPRFDTTIRLQ